MPAGRYRGAAELREKCHNSLLGILLSRGANRTEAEDLLADLWADCVPGQTIGLQFGEIQRQMHFARLAGDGGDKSLVDRKRRQSVLLTESG